MERIKLDDIYPWKRTSENKYPWVRQYLHYDFLKYEKHRIAKVGEWYKKFCKAKIGENLDEVEYYLVPVELNSDWKVAIRKKGNYVFKGLSALRNNIQINILMIVDENLKLATDYSLIRITKSKKDFIHDEKNNQAEYVLKIEEFEEIDSMQVYVDVPFEKQSVQKFIKENLISSPLIAKSFGSSISGAPYVANDKGGISLSNFTGTSRFSEELIKTLKLMQPPELTDISFQLPQTLLKGRKILSRNGIRFLVADRPIPSKNVFEAFSTSDYTVLDNELAKRRFHVGEFSIACSISPHTTTTSELLRDFISKFVKTEITNPFNTDELKYDYDIDLLKARKNIGEDLWLQIVNQKQMMPETSKPDKKIQENLLVDWEVIYEKLGLTKHTEHEVRVYSKASYNNILRVAQSLARDRNTEKITKEIMNEAYNLFSENAHAMTENETIKRNAHVIIPEKWEGKKFNAVRVELSTNVLDIKSLFENVKSYFQSINALQEFVDRLVLEGYVFQPRQGYYEWVRK